MVLTMGQGGVWGLSEVMEHELCGRSDCKELAVDVKSSCFNVNTKLERHGKGMGNCVSPHVRLK